MSPRRLTRSEQREKTRGCLVEAAAKVFTRRGYDKASLDEVAEEAGFTKGAVYSNFKGKEELFLATIDAHFDERLQSIKRVMQEEPDEQGTAHAAGMDFMNKLNADPEYFALFFEFWAYAQRNPSVKKKFLPRVQRFRAALAELFEAKSDAGLELPIPSEQLASMLIAMAAGVTMERELDPKSVPDDMYARMLQFFFRGMLAEDGQSGVDVHADYQAVS
jgi:AcrR family transcriptional regulator